MMKRIFVGFIAFSISIFIVQDAFGQDPPIKRYVSPHVATSQLIYDGKRYTSSDDVCNGPSIRNVPSLISGSSNLLLSEFKSKRTPNSESDRRVQLDIAWKDNSTGVVSVKISYRRQIYHRLRCRFKSWKDLYTYEIHREYINPGATIGGAISGTADNSETVNEFNLTYKPSTQDYLDPQFCGIGGTTPSKTCGLAAKKFKVLSGVDEDGNNQLDDWSDDIDILRSSKGTYSETPFVLRTKGLGNFSIVMQVYTEINNDENSGKWFSVHIPTTVSVNPSCYPDNFSAATVLLNVPAENNLSEDGQPVFRVDKNQTYTLGIDGITDFYNKYRWNFDDFGTDVSTPGDDTFIPLKDGSYRISIEPTQDGCHPPLSVQILVGDKNARLDNQCSLQLPRDLSLLYPCETSDSDCAANNQIILRHFAAYVESSRSVSVMPGVTLENGAELFIENEPEGPATDLNKNFTEHKTFDEYGRITLQSRSYFDEFGRSVQSQSKNLSNDIVLANASLRDALGREAIQTLSAPIVHAESNACPEDSRAGSKIDFTFKPDFVKAADGNVYGIEHFDLIDENGLSNESTPVALETNTEGTLGWYFGHQNTDEPWIAVTSYPYSRTLYKNDGSGQVKSVTRPGDEFKAGSIHLATANQLPTDAGDESELNAYLDIRELRLQLGRPAEIEGEFFKTESFDGAGHKSVVYTDKAGHSIISIYYGTGSIQITKSYQFYDNAGRLLVNISPNGIQQYQAAGGTNFSAIDKTSYFYDSKGRLASIEEKVAGQNPTGVSTIQYVYRTDGKIRFSQNEEQRKTGRYSYTNYDGSGRPLESGEYTPLVNGIMFNSPAMTGLLESSAEDGGLADNSGTKHERTFTFYDSEDSDTPVPNDRVQRFLYGAVSYTKRENYITTWYSYDDQGRIEWLIQDIRDPNDNAMSLGVKTIDYRYGPNGAVQEVVYQKGGPDQFTHFYEYDADGRLSKAFTTRELLDYNKEGNLTNAEVLEHEATYYYYLHGPLKRVELSTRRREDINGNYVLTTLQGIDYRYMADGSLKAINHSDSDLSKDPGNDNGAANDQDGEGGPLPPVKYNKDAFGMILDYFPDDYISANGRNESITYSGNSHQYTGLVKATRWHSPTAEIDRTNNNQLVNTFGYAYTYDDRDQFQEATWGRMENNVFSPNVLKPYHESVFELDENDNKISGYDANGNILRLKRNSNILKPQSYLDYDLKYNYKPLTNMLTGITRKMSNNDEVTFRSYEFNDLGQMTMENREGEIRYLAYGVSGKVTGVYADDEVGGYTDAIVTFVYDDRGFRLSKTSYDENYAPVERTWYVRDHSGNLIATYVQDMILETPAKPVEAVVYASGKIGVYKYDFGFTFYELTDHLGNVRAVVGDEIKAEYLATMEDARVDIETNPNNEEHFINMTSVPVASHINYTPSPVSVNEQPEYIGEPGKAIRLNNTLGQNPNAIGVGKMLMVFPGDQVTASVQVKCSQFTTDTNPINGLAALLTTTFGAINPVDGSSIFDISGNGEYSSFLLKEDAVDDNPKAFLNYILVDNEFNVIDFDFKQATDAAVFPEDPLELQEQSHEELTFTLTIPKQGTLYIYVSNESNQSMDAYFDDLRIKHRYSNIVGGSDYYPYGLTIKDREITREPYRYGYQGGFSEKDEETGWNHFELREYDPVIGRWTTKDPMGQHPTPYMGMGNNPVNSWDPNGGFDWYYNEVTGELVQNRNEGKGYEKKLGENWKWLAEDDAFQYGNSGWLPDPENTKFDKNGWYEMRWSAYHAEGIISGSDYKMVPTHYFELIKDYKATDGMNMMTSQDIDQVWDRVAYVPQNYVMLDKHIIHHNNKYYKGTVRVYEMEYKNVKWGVNEVSSWLDFFFNLSGLYDGDIPGAPVVYKSWYNYKGPLLKYRK